MCLRTNTGKYVELYLGRILIWKYEIRTINNFEKALHLIKFVIRSESDFQSWL